MSTTVVDLDDGTREVTIPLSAPPVVSDFIEDSAFVTGYFGPFGCAKTTAGAFKAWCYSQVYPGSRGIITRDTWPNLRDTTQKTFFEWFPDGAVGHYEVTPKTFWVDTPEGTCSEIQFLPLDDERDIKNALSRDFAWIWFDEPQGGISMKHEGQIATDPGVAHKLFQMLLGRAGRQKGYPGMAWLTGNPPSPKHWIAQEFAYDPGDSGQDPPTNTRHEIIELEHGTGTIEVDFRLYLGNRDTNRAHLERGYYERLERIFGRGTPLALRFLDGKWIDFAVSKPFASHWITWAGQGDAPTCPTDMTLEIVAGIDPAVSTKDASNRTAIVVVAQVRTGVLRGRVFVLACLAGHWTPAEQARQLVAAVRKWNIRTVRIEKVAYQEALAPLIEREAKDAGVHVNIELKRPTADKPTRANAWSGLVENGVVIFTPGNGTEELVKAMLAVPDEKGMWDPVDAAGLAISYLSPFEADQVVIATPQQTAEFTRARGYAVRPTREVARGRTLPRIGHGRRAPGTNPSSPQRAIGYATRRPTSLTRNMGR